MIENKGYGKSCTAIGQDLQDLQDNNCPLAEVLLFCSSENPVYPVQKKRSSLSAAGAFDDGIDEGASAVGRLGPLPNFLYEW